MNETAFIKPLPLSETVTVRMDEDMKKELAVLKATHRFDYPEWIRAFIREELPNVKKKLGVKSA